MSRLRRALLGLVVAAIFLVGLELVLRLVGPPAVDAEFDALKAQPGAAMRDADYGWRLQPGAPVEDPTRAAWDQQWGLPAQTLVDRVNRHGFRDSALADPRPPEQRRVLVLGDSSVYGSGVPPQLRFTELAQDHFGVGDAESRRVEVINGGVPGWTSSQSLVQLRDSLHLGLDAVVVYSMNSDMMAVEGGVSDDAYFGARERLVGVGMVGRLMTSRWLRHLVSPALPQAERGATTTTRVPLAAYQDNLRRIAAIADQHELGLIFMIAVAAADVEDHRAGYMPSSPQDVVRLRGELDRMGQQDAEGHQKSWYRMAMALVGEELGVAVVDGPAAIHQAWRQDPQRYTAADGLFVDAIHPSRTGHAVLAQALTPVLAEVLGTVEPWAQRRQRVPDADPPDWLSDSLPEHDQAQTERVSTPTVAGPPVGLTELDCRSEQAGPDEVLVPLDFGGLESEQPLLISVLSIGIENATEQAMSICWPTGGSLSLPRSMGRVRITAVVDADNDGPCRIDLAAASAPIDLRGAVSPALLQFSTAAELGAWGPPFGLAYGAYPLLALMAQDDHVDDGAGLVIEPAVATGIDVVAAVVAGGRALEEQGVQSAVVDVLDRPETPLSTYDLLVVVDSLGGGLPSRVSAAVTVPTRRVDGWTDPSGRAWTVLALEHPPDSSYTSRAADQPLLAAGEGRRSATGAKLLPPELRRAEGP